MDHFQQCVLEFHRSKKCISNDSPTLIDGQSMVRRASLISEEFAEFLKAARTSDMLGMCDALADLLYVTYGTCVELGIDIQPFFEEVHRSNMTKVAAHDVGGKVMKGAGYIPPDLGAILKLQVPGVAGGQQNV